MTTADGHRRPRVPLASPPLTMAKWKLCSQLSPPPCRIRSLAPPVYRVAEHSAQYRPEHLADHRIAQCFTDHRVAHVGWRWWCAGLAGAAAPMAGVAGSFCGGDAGAFAKATDALDAIASRAALLGPGGAGAASEAD